MSCYHPVLARDYGIDPLTGKHKVKLMPLRVDYNLKQLRDRYGDSLLLLPCGKCIGCLNDYKNQWATRILLEAALYEKNSFITLTYRDSCLPADNRPHRDEFVLFMKRLRKAIGQKVRVFYVGEKGDQSGRAHYHAIIFGYDFPDKVVHGMTSKGSTIYTSKLLEQCWPFGLSSVGDVEPGSACYVAQYSNKKKMTGKDDGSFIGMSRRPGLGADCFDMKWFKSDTIYCALGEATIPRFFHSFLESLKPEYYALWKASRVLRASQVPPVFWKYDGIANEERALDYEHKYKLLQYFYRVRSSL